MIFMLTCWYYTCISMATGPTRTTGDAWVWITAATIAVAIFSLVGNSHSTSDVQAPPFTSFDSVQENRTVARNGIIVMLISAIVGAILGSLFAVLWDMHKSRIERSLKDQAILSELKGQTSENVSSILANQELLNREVEVLEQHRTTLQPLRLLETGAWPLMRIDVPQQLQSRASLLSMIQKNTRLTSSVDELITARETYKQFNAAETVYYQQLLLYDRALLKQEEDLFSLTSQLNQQLQQIK
jgi:hypothetical protein